MTTDMTLKKAEAALSIILDHDEKNSNISFRQVLDEIILSWKELQ